MIEIGIISILVLAAGYWVTLWLMGRHNDVLHGDFVHGEPGYETAEMSDRPFAARPPFPPKPIFPEKKALSGGINAVKPAPGKSGSAHALPHEPSAVPSVFSERSETLQSLLVSIKQDLKDASQL